VVIDFSGHSLMAEAPDATLDAADRVPPAVTRLFITVFAALLPLLAGAQYPAKPVKIMVPAQPGGGLASSAAPWPTSSRAPSTSRSSSRTPARRRHHRLDDHGARGVRRLHLMSATSARTAPIAVSPKLPYDAIKDSSAGRDGHGGRRNLLVSLNPAAAGRSRRAFIELPRQNPAKVNYGTGAIGLLNHSRASSSSGPRPARGAPPYAHLCGIGPAIADISAADPRADAGSRRRLPQHPRRQATLPSRCALRWCRTFDVRGIRIQGLRWRAVERAIVGPAKAARR